MHHTWNAVLLPVVYLTAQVCGFCVQPSLLLPSAGPQNCPSVCSCSNQFSKVVCTRRGLSEVPQGIPSNTQYLNLMENNIQMIQADTFRHLHHSGGLGSWAGTPSGR